MRASPCSQQVAERDRRAVAIPGIHAGAETLGTHRRHLTGAHTKHRLRFHCVWTPKYRKAILVGPVAVALRGLLQTMAHDNRWTLHELNVQKDHVHMLLQLKPDTSVARAMQLLKGGTSFRLRREFPELQKIVQRGSLWGEGYFAESVGVVEEETIRRYIRAQPDKDESIS